MARTVPIAPAVLAAFTAVLPVQPPDPDTTARREFAPRVEAYDALRREVSARVLHAAPSFGPLEIHQRVESLRAALRAARPDARPGDVFDPEISRLFRRLIRQSCDGDFAELLAVTGEEDDLEGPLLPPVVNGRWPAEALPSMPPTLLRTLPALPEDLQYRFVHHDLVLWDSRADLIVDVLTGAIPPLTLP